MNSFTEEPKKDNCRCEYEENIEILREIPFFARVGLDALKVFAYLCTREIYKPGDYLVEQGEDDGQAYYLLSGDAVLYRTDNGKDCRLRELPPKAFIGGLSLLTTLPRLFSVRAESEVRCLRLTRDKFAKVLEQFPELTATMMKTAVERVHAWEQTFLKKHAQDCTECKWALGVTLI